MKKILITFFIFISVNCFAATYYVEDKGNATLNTTDEGATSWSNATNILTPTSPQTSMTYAVAGDIVLFRAGTYQLGNIPDRGLNQALYQNILQPTNSGTSGSQITFKNYPDEVVTLNGLSEGTESYYYSTGAALFVNPIGVYRVNYVTIDGFKLTCDSGTNMAGVVVGYHELDTNVVGNIVKNCEIDGGGTPNGNGQYNLQGIRLEDTDGTIIEYNTIYGFNGIDDNHNTSAIKYYHNENVILRNNEIYESDVAIFDKSRGISNTIENNYVHGVNEAVLITNLFSEEPGNNGTIKNNIFYTAGSGINIDTQVEATGWVINNNTIYSPSASGLAASAGLRITTGTGYDIYNNIFIITPNGYHYWNTNPGIVGASEMDHNLFDDLNSTTILIRIYTVDPFWTTFTEIDGTPNWQEFDYLSAAVDVGCGSSINPGCGSLDTEPTFTNTSGTMSTVADFALTAASAGYQADRSSNDMGVDVTNVGTGADPSPSETSSSIGPGTSSTFTSGDSTVIN